jgi:hypothetical protein
VTSKPVFLLRRSHTEFDRGTVAEVLHNQLRRSFSIVDDDYSRQLSAPYALTIRTWTRSVPPAVAGGSTIRIQNQ